MNALTNNQDSQVKQVGIFQSFAAKYQVDENEMMNTLKRTAFRQSGNNSVSNEQMMSLLIVANEYNLNPFTKEIYAFPSNGGIQPIVSIDGWMKIINAHPDYDGMEFVDSIANGKVASVTCSIFRKTRAHPTSITEYLSECQRGTDPWKKWPARMLRHKAAIQCARYAFGFSGIVDPDEGDRISESTQGEPLEVSGEVLRDEVYSDEDFDKSFPAWEKLILDGKSAKDLITYLESKGVNLNDNQISIIKKVKGPKK